MSDFVCSEMLVIQIWIDKYVHLNAILTIIHIKHWSIVTKPSTTFKPLQNKRWTENTHHRRWLESIIANTHIFGIIQLLPNNSGMLLRIITSYVLERSNRHSTANYCHYSCDNCQENNLTFQFNDVHLPRSAFRVRFSKHSFLFFFFIITVNGSVPPTVLLSLINEHLIKDEIALNFLLEVCSTIKQEKGLNSLTTILKKGNVEGR